MQVEWGFYKWGSFLWGQQLSVQPGPLWGSYLWRTFFWGEVPAPSFLPCPFGQGFYGHHHYGRRTYYAQPAPPRPDQFVMPAEALDPSTPLMSLAASGAFSTLYIFKIQRIKTPLGYDSVDPRQIVQPYYLPKYTRTTCKTYLRQSFAEAVAAWQALPENLRAPYAEKVNHYGLVMNPRNLFISRFMKDKIKSPQNPCPKRVRRDNRRLRRIPGRT